MKEAAGDTHSSSIHFRLSHLSCEQLKYVDAYTCTNSRHHGVCQICLLAKMHRSRFPLSTSRARDCFDLLHVDIWGPYPHSTCDGAKFLLSIADDFPRAIPLLRALLFLLRKSLVLLSK